MDEQRGGLLGGVEDEGVGEGGNGEAEGTVREREDGAEDGGSGGEGGERDAGGVVEERDERRRRREHVREAQDVAQVEKVQTLVRLHLQAEGDEVHRDGFDLSRSACRSGDGGRFESRQGRRSRARKQAEPEK